MTQRIHKGCDGEIVNNKCKKCDRTWGRIARTVGKDIEHIPEQPDQFDSKKYRKRIRKGNDIFKEK